MPGTARGPAGRWPVVAWWRTSLPPGMSGSAHASNRASRPRLRLDRSLHLFAAAGHGYVTTEQGETLSPNPDFLSMRLIRYGSAGGEELITDCEGAGQAKLRTLSVPVRGCGDSTHGEHGLMADRTGYLHES